MIAWDDDLVQARKTTRPLDLLADAAFILLESGRQLHTATHMRVQGYRLTSAASRLRRVCGEGISRAEGVHHSVHLMVVNFKQRQPAEDNAAQCDAITAAQCSKD